MSIIRDVQQRADLVHTLAWMQKGREVSRALVFEMILAVSGRRRGHRDRLGQFEVENRFRRQLDFLSLGHALDACARCCTGPCPDRRSFAATRDRTDDCAKSSASANGCSSALTTRRAFLVPLARSEVITLSIDVEHSHL